MAVIIGVAVLGSAGLMRFGSAKTYPLLPGGEDADYPKRAAGVCPPFKLLDEDGGVIDPVHGVNADVPYSPRKTCGACHDYEKITQGFHFTQGKGETVPDAMAERYAWVTAPGNYGGNWCSPAPLYRQLAAKTNASARVIDMTSFEFISASCGTCHPGGGPLETDREGKRYDRWMRDPASGFTDSGDNRFDGDYHKARWARSGVIEADCLMCHLPDYDFKIRNAHLKKLNFKWAATAAAGFGKVTGGVISNEQPRVAYDLSRFDAQGRVLVKSVPHPRNETCLTCHAKPGWKKRGASFSPRTDVHMAAGLRCVDCHPAGSRAADARVRGREVHQIGKGDDPAGWVRNDLDGTMRSCRDCHIDGWRNAPRASHAWLPPLHMEKLSCQACHIPNRAVMSASVQASDVFNPAPYITPPGKHIWTFYDHNRQAWNHYGELNTFGYADQPTDFFLPTLFVYKGLIYPGNRVHSMWVGYEEEGKPGLNMLFMRDYYAMWRQHNESGGTNFTQLAAIRDDDGDGALEINRPEEIDAVLAATREYLAKTGFLMLGRRLVWVCDDRAYYSSTESRALPRESYEATPYASVHKYSHDVAPARAALGTGGCTDCHASPSPFFDRPVLRTVFATEDSLPRWMPNRELLGVSESAVRIGAFREQRLKPVLYALAGLLAGLWALVCLRDAAVHHDLLPKQFSSVCLWAGLVGLAAAGLVVSRDPGMGEYMLARRFTLDANHFWVAIGILLAAFAAVVRLSGGGTAQRILRAAGWSALAATCLCGGLMLMKPDGFLAAATRLAYTGFDAGLVLSAAFAILALLFASPIRRPGEGE